MNPRFIAAIAGLAVLAYLPFLGLPFISDDYTQVRMARQYGHPGGWAGLADDALYRSRATSLLLTAAIDAVWGLAPWAHHLAALGLHVANALLVALLGCWRRVGYAVSLPAAVFFAVYEGHQEAVVWYAAVHDLLVFFFGALTVLAWVRWLQGQGRSWRWGLAAGVCYALALYSKESGVAVGPVLALVWWLEARDRRGPLVVLALLGAGSVAYALSIFGASASHLHLNDGTFRMQAGFAWRALHSLLRMLWIWGLAAAALLLWRRDRPGIRLGAAALGWMLAALLPYSFLTYMTRVPSRHTYLAAAGLALLAGAAWRARPEGRAWAAGLALAVVLHNAGYLWVRKLPQYERRMAATERFLDFARRHEGPIVVECSPYAARILDDVASVGLGRAAGTVFDAADGGVPDGAARYCDRDHP